jgi:hypothetical protein
MYAWVVGLILPLLEQLTKCGGDISINIKFLSSRSSSLMAKLGT